MCGCGHVIQLTLAINHLCFLNLLYFCLWYKYVLFIATVFAWNSGRCFMFPLSRLPRVLPVPREWRCLAALPPRVKALIHGAGGLTGSWPYCVPFPKGMKVSSPGHVPGMPRLLLGLLWARGGESVDRCECLSVQAPRAVFSHQPTLRNVPESFSPTLAPSAQACSWVCLPFLLWMSSWLTALWH